MTTYTCSCGAKYRFELRLSGRRARCRRCRTPFRVPSPDEQQDLLAFVEDPAAEPQAMTAAAAAPLPPLRPASDEPLPSHGPSPWARDLYAMACFPRNLSETLRLLGIIAVMALSAAYLTMSLASGFHFTRAIIFGAIIEGSLLSFAICALQQEAHGERDLPAFPFTFVPDIMEVWHTQIAPLLAFLASVAIAGAPWLIFFLVLRSQPSAVGGGFAPAERAVLYALAGCGALLWPLIVMVIALGGFSRLIRLGWGFVAMAHSLPAYLGTVALVYGATAIGWLAQNIRLGEGRLPAIASIVLAAAIHVYTAVFSMRAIGLYYRRNAKLFQWL